MPSKPGTGSASVMSVSPSCSARSLLPLGHEVDELGLDDSVVAAQRAVVEPQHLLAGLDPHAVAHEDAVDDAAVAVLDQLDVAADSELAAGDDRTIEMRRRRPATQSDDEQATNEQAGEQLVVHAAATGARA